MVYVFTVNFVQCMEVLQPTSRQRLDCMSIHGCDSYYVFKLAPGLGPVFVEAFDDFVDMCAVDDDTLIIQVCFDTVCAATIVFRENRFFETYLTQQFYEHLEDLYDSLE